jgi:hypothetical protein
MMQYIGEWLYRILENIDGEHGKKRISYQIAEKIKIWLLENWIN